MNALKHSRKIAEFYIHQTAAIDAIRQGKHVIVSTSTASGKSVIYQVSVFVSYITRHIHILDVKVPVLNFLEENHHSTAIFIYPTKVR